MNIKSLIKKILFGINGIASVVFSIICFCMYDGSYEFNATYGAMHTRAFRTLRLRQPAM